MQIGKKRFIYLLINYHNYIPLKTKSVAGERGLCEKEGKMYIVIKRVTLVIIYIYIHKCMKIETNFKRSSPYTNYIYIHTPTKAPHGLDNSALLVYFFLGGKKKKKSTFLIYLIFIWKDPGI